jgi:fructokinase
MLRIGIDLGGTKIEGIVLDAPPARLRPASPDSGAVKELFRKRVDTQQEKGYAHILDRI